MNIRNKNVLITGAEGFIGSHLVEELFKQGCKIRAFVFYNFSNSWGWLDTLPKETLEKIEIIVGDIRDLNRVKEAVRGMEIIFHLAALIGIPYSYHAADSYVDTNIKGTLNVLQAAKESNIKKILVTSTSEVYGTAKYVPIDEKHPRQGQSPYSATKIGSDCIAESFYRSFNLPVTIVRPFNTYGPRQSARAIIPTIITQLLSGNNAIKLGALRPTRDFVFVKDTASAFVEIAKSEKVLGEDINIASQAEVSVKDITERLIDMINPKAKIIKDKKRLRPKKSEVERLLGSNKKIKRLTNWKPKHSFNQGLDKTVEWFKDKNNMKLYKWDIYNA